ncbi:MAG: hypothetical protein QOI41_5110 [Myxococcales bacterium]|nr:hypothetical protein [Myxococcales bacterium]
MRLADAPADDAADGTSITLSPALLRGDARLEALFEPFRECVVLHETLIHEGSAARASRLLMAEIRADRLDEVRALVREVCAKGSFEEKPTELDDVAGGTEWRERSGPLSIAAYRLFGGSTSLHVTSAKLDPPDAGTRALLASPLSPLGELVESTSFVEHLSCSRSAGDVPTWNLRAALRDLRRFEEIVPRVVALGFEDRRGKYWRERIIVQPVGKDRWMAAVPGIDFATR